jgi:tetratricopeptide (TPR) repeat protein
MNSPEGTADPKALAQSAADLATASMSAGSPPPATELAHARAGLARALAQAPADLEVLFLAFQFHVRLGELDPAEEWVQRRLELAPPGSAHAARALSNLGLIAHLKGDQERAASLFARAVEINRSLGDMHALARDLGNSALAFEAQGDLERAESLTREAMGIAQGLPGPKGEELVASGLSNLADFARARGQHAAARDLMTRSFEAFERLGVSKWKASFAKRFAELEQLERGGPKG